jgi:hypothetical protein
LFAKPSQVEPSISLKTKGDFGRKKPFQNLWIMKQERNPVKTTAGNCIKDHLTLRSFSFQCSRVKMSADSGAQNEFREVGATWFVCAPARKVSAAVQAAARRMSTKPNTLQEAIWKP